MTLNDLIWFYGDLWKCLLPQYIDALPSQTLGFSQIKVLVGIPHVAEIGIKYAPSKN